MIQNNDGSCGLEDHMIRLKWNFSHFYTTIVPKNFQRNTFYYVFPLNLFLLYNTTSKNTNGFYFKMLYTLNRKNEIRYHKQNMSTRTYLAKHNKFNSKIQIQNEYLPKTSHTICRPIDVLFV